MLTSQLQNQEINGINFASMLASQKPSAKTALKTDEILEKLGHIYLSNIRPIEEMYKFNKFNNYNLLNMIDFKTKPMILLIGPYSVGKTSFIRYVLGRDFPGMRIGIEPTTDSFTAIMHGKTETLIPGNIAIMDQLKPFQTLSKFGMPFLNKFNCAELSHSNILNFFTFIDTPGILSDIKHNIKNRNYNLFKVIQWFGNRSDRIILLFDVFKIDMSDEFLKCIKMLLNNENENKFRMILNKADCITNQQLLRVYGSLMWSLGKVFKTPEVLRVYVGSFWDHSYQNKHNLELFNKEKYDLFADLLSLAEHCAVSKINNLIKRIEKLKIHCFLIEYFQNKLNKNNNSFGFNKSNKKQKLLDNLKQEFTYLQQIMPSNKYSINDFYTVNQFKQYLKDVNILHLPPKFKNEWKQSISNVCEKQIPLLLEQLQHSKNFN